VCRALSARRAAGQLETTLLGGSAEVEQQTWVYLRGGDVHGGVHDDAYLVCQGGHQDTWADTWAGGWLGSACVHTHGRTDD